MAKKKSSSINFKLHRIVFISVAVALFTITAWQSVYSYTNEKENARKMLTGYAQLISKNASNAIANNQPDWLVNLLHSLRELEGVELAALYSIKGKPLATYGVYSANVPVLPETWPPYRFDKNFLHIYENVYDTRDARIGVVYIRYDLQVITQALLNKLLLGLVAALVAFFLTLLFATGLRKSILKPIRNLREAALHVVKRKDYSIRVEKDSDDVVGDLSDAFNEMLLQLQVRDAALMQNNSELEKRVNARTEELSSAKHKAEKAVQSKADFLASMSHEIRTPMNGILGIASLLAETELDDEQQDFLSTMQKSADSLLQIINDILDFSKIEAGKLDFEILPFDLEEALEDVVRIMSFKAVEKGLDLNLSIDPKLPTMVMGDVGRIKQIITNFIGNAVKFTDIGKIDLEVTGKELDDNHVSLKFAVKDTGIGIPQNKLDSIFERFSQADNSTTRKYGGTGLGLSISQQLAELMQGEIYAESEVGKGSTFYFIVSLPLDYSIDLVSQAAAPVNNVNPAAAIPTPADSNKVSIQMRDDFKVLLVEDNLINQKVAASMLQKLGCQHVDLAENGNDAFEKIKQNAYDIVFMDCHMPICDGYEATKKVRLWEQESGMHEPLLIVALTANVMQGEREICLKSGMTDYLGKPVKLDAFQNILKTYKSAFIQSASSAAPQVQKPTSIEQPALSLVDPEPEMQAPPVHQPQSTQQEPQPQPQSVQEVVQQTVVAEPASSVSAQPAASDAQDANREHVSNVKVSKLAPILNEIDLEKAATQLADERQSSALSQVQKAAASVVGSSSITEVNPEFNVLLVEDNPVNQKVAAGLLKKLGFKNIDVAENGQIGVEKVQKSSYDLVFMDCHMPVCDGYEATQRIRAWEAEVGAEKPLVIVALTANVMQGEREVCLKAGMTDYLGKPVKLKDFKDILDMYFKSIAAKITS